MAELELQGDADLIFTAPLRVGLGEREGADPLARLRATPDVELAADDWDRIFRGSLTFQDARPAEVARFSVEGGLREAVCELVRARSEFPGVSAAVAGVAFVDGSVAIAVTISVPDGWSRNRGELMAAFGPAGRDELATELRRIVLEWARAAELPAPGSDAAPELPYFNLTYVGRVVDPRAGRAVIDTPELRALVYPRSPGPLESCSTLDEEYLYAGYAFLLLGVPPGSATPEKLRDLLLILDVLYAQLAQGAAAAKDYLIDGDDALDVADWEQLERDLRMRYREVATPTFSFDHHVLAMRNTILEAWGAADLLERSQELLAWGDEAQTRRELAKQARRSRVFNVILGVIAVLAVFDTADSVWSLIDRL